MNDWKKEIIKSLCFGAFIFIFWMILQYMNPQKDILIERTDTRTPDIVAGEIYGDNVVLQKLFIGADTNALIVKFCNYDNFGDGEAVFELINSDEETVYQNKFSRDEIKNNYDKTFLLGDVKRDQEYTMAISAPSLTQENAISVWTTSNETIADNMSYKYNNEERTNCSICFATAYKQFNYLSILALCLVLITSIAWFYNRNSKIEIQAMIIIFGIGLSYMAIIPPFGEPDAIYHYNSSYILSNIVLQKENSVKIYNESYYEVLDRKMHIYISSDGAKDVLDKFFSKEKTCDYRYPEIQSYYDNMSYPLMYVGGALGIIMGRLLHLNAIQIYYLGRICNFILYCLIVLWAIIQSKRKLLVFAVAALPICFQQSVGYTYDAMVNSLSILLFILLINSINREGDYSYREWLINSIVFTVFVPIKIIYYIIGVIALAIPKKRYKSTLDYAFRNGIFFGTPIIVLALTRLFLAKERAVSQVGNVYNFNWCIHHIKKAFSIYFQSIFMKMWDWFLESFGGILVGYIVPSWIICFFVIMILLIAGKEYQDDVSNKNRILIWVSSIVTAFLIIALFITSTKRENEIITQVQGRYFVPLLLPVFYTVRTRIGQKCNNTNLIFGTYICLHVITLNQILTFLQPRSITKIIMEYIY